MMMYHSESAYNDRITIVIANAFCDPPMQYTNDSVKNGWDQTCVITT